MKDKKTCCMGFYILNIYGIFWSILLGPFIRHKPLISDAWNKINEWYWYIIVNRLIALEETLINRSNSIRISRFFLRAWGIISWCYDLKKYSDSPKWYSYLTTYRLRRSPDAFSWKSFCFVMFVPSSVILLFTSVSLED